jgi:hypothetical protein
MFEVGKRYTIKMWEDGEDGGVLVHDDECEVIAIAIPLIKIRQPTGEEVIVNTASPLCRRRWTSTPRLTLEEREGRGRERGDKRRPSKISTACGASSRA